MQRGRDHVDAQLMLAGGVRGLELLVARRVVERAHDGGQHRCLRLPACSW